MQLERASVGRCARDREAAATAFGEDHVEVLAGAVVQFLHRGKAQRHRHDVLGEPLEALDAGRQALHLDLRRRSRLARLDAQVGERPRLAQQRVAVGGLLLREPDGSRTRVLEVPRQHAGPARGAVATLAAVGQVEARAQRGREHRLAGLGEEGLSGRDQGDLGHASGMIRDAHGTGARACSRILARWRRAA